MKCFAVVALLLLSLPAAAQTEGTAFASVSTSSAEPFVEQLPAAPAPAPRRTFLSNKTNRMLVGGDLATRLLDAWTTRRVMSSPCRCSTETGTLFGISLAPAAKSTPGQYSLSVGLSAAMVTGARFVWNRGDRSPRYHRLYHAAARLWLASDIAVDGDQGAINNIQQMPPSVPQPATRPIATSLRNQF